MTVFRGSLVGMWTVLTVYTVIVIENHGMGLFAVFFGDMGKMGWPGQFNLDFLFMLASSAMWVAWRHSFTPGGLLLAVVAFTGGTAFLAPYLLILSFQEKGDMKSILLGRLRAAA
jgi:hypothetical protein